MYGNVAYNKTHHSNLWWILCLDDNKAAISLTADRDKFIHMLQPRFWTSIQIKLKIVPEGLIIIFLFTLV